MIGTSACVISDSSVAPNFYSSYRILPGSFRCNTPSVDFWAAQSVLARRSLLSRCAPWASSVVVPPHRHHGRHEDWNPQDGALASVSVFSSTLFVVLSRLDLLVSSDMLLQSPDRTLLLNCPIYCHQADCRNNRTKHKKNVHVPLGARNRFVEEVDSEREENGGKQNAETAFFSHRYLAKCRLSYPERSQPLVNNFIIELLFWYKRT